MGGCNSSPAVSTSSPGALPSEAMLAEGQVASEAGVLALFDKHDVDQDRLLDREEFRGFCGKVFDMLPQGLDKAEILCLWEGNFLDDGKVNLGEFRQVVEAIQDFARHQTEPTIYPDGMLSMYTDFLLGVLGKVINQNKGKPIPDGSDMKLPPAEEPDMPYKVSHGVKILKYDRTTRGSGEPPAMDKLALTVANWILPWNSNTDTWPSHAEAKQVMSKYFSPLLGGPSVVWLTEGEHADRALERNMCQGAGAFMVQRRDEQTMEVNLLALQALEVQPGYCSFGARVVMTDKGEVVEIEYGGATTEKGNNFTLKPGEEGWEHARFAANTSAYVYQALIEHLTFVHYLASNAGSHATMTTLPAAHPLRRLLHILTYSATYTNNMANVVLMNKYGIVNRFGLEYSGIQKAVQLGCSLFKYESFPERMRRQGMNNADPNIFPIVADGSRYWAVAETWMRAYVDLYYSSDEEVAADASLATFWSKLRGLYPSESKPEPEQLVSKAALCKYLTYLLFNVSAAHEHVGAAKDYSFDPYFSGIAVRPDVAYAGPQGASLNAVIAALTCVKLPPITGNFDHLFLDDAARKLHANFRAQCLELGEKIDAENESSRRQPYRLMDPRKMECSVSV